MDDLVQQLTSKTGITADVAKQVIDVVLSFLKQRLPKSIADQLETLISGGKALSGVSDVMKGFGGLFGGGDKK